MKILMFGATGATGRHCVTQALAQGHQVTAFVRDPARSTWRDPSFACVSGDVMDAASVARAMPGHDAVLCALGNLPDGTADRNRRQRHVPVCSVGTGHIVAAMTTHAVRRLVVESSTSVGESLGAGRYGASIVVRLLLGDVMDDKERQETVVRASALDWTLVRPARLVDRPARGRLRSGPDLRWSLASTASRADVAAFMIAAVTDASLIGRAVTVRD